jgi:hypothetical protein
MVVYTEILAQLEQLSESGKNVKLLNVFKGIPVSYEASIRRMDGLLVEFNVHRYQVLCLEIEKQTIIQDGGLLSPIKADVLTVDKFLNTAYLYNFTYASQTVGLRSTIRVQPEHPIEVQIARQNLRMRGTLIDISLEGAGMQLTLVAFVYGARTLTKGTTTKVSLLVPGEKTELQLPGTVSYIIRQKEFYRLGISARPDLESKRILSQYITQRQVAIWRELRLMADVFTRPSDRADPVSD